MFFAQIEEFEEKIKKIWDDYISHAIPNYNTIKNDVSCFSKSIYKSIEDINDPLSEAAKVLDDEKKRSTLLSLQKKTCIDKDIQTTKIDATKIVTDISELLKISYDSVGQVTNTFSLIFVSSCNFICLKYIDAVINYKEILSYLVKYIKNEKDRKYLYFTGKGIMLRGVDNIESDQSFDEAYRIFPQYDAVKIYKFIRLCLYANTDEWYYERILEEYGVRKDEDPSFRKCYMAFAELSYNAKQLLIKSNSEYTENIFLPKILDAENYETHWDNDYRLKDTDNRLKNREHCLFMPVYIPYFRVIISRAKDFESKVLDKLKQITQMLSEIKNKNNRRLAILNPSSEEFEIEISKIINALSQKVSGSLTKSDLDDAEENLKLFFGDNIWNGLEDGTKTSLKSASFLMKSCNELSAADDMDYSGICICATSALEREIKRVFYYGFKKYCESLPENPIPFTMANSEGSSFINENNFTLGSFRYALGDYPKNRWNTFDDDKKDKVTKSRRIMSEYLKEHLVSETNCDPIDKFRKSKSGYNNSFLKQCEDIKERYRNPAAHTDRIKRKEAQDCYDSIVGKSMGEQHIEDVKGVLKYLYEIIDISTIDISES